VYRLLKAIGTLIGAALIGFAVPAGWLRLGGALSGESARVLAESGGGVVVEPGDARAVADAVLELYRDPARRAAMGEAGRRYVEENYSRAAWAGRLEQRIVELCGRAAAERPAPTAEEFQQGWTEEMMNAD
jgi:hypothetical protein